MLTDPTRCQVMLVTLPEETPVNELVETAYQPRGRVGRQPRARWWSTASTRELAGLDADPDAAAAAEAGARLRAGEADALRRGGRRSGADRMALQAEQVARLGRALPLPQLRLPVPVRRRARPGRRSTLLADAACSAEHRRASPEPS